MPMTDSAGHRTPAATWRQGLKTWLPPVLLALAIFVQSAFPSPQPFPDLRYGDKYLHLVVYGLLAALVFRAAAATWPDRPLRLLMAAAVLVVSLYGASDEWHQAFVPGRWADPLDWFADSVGAIAGVLLAGLLWRRQMKMASSP